MVSNKVTTCLETASVGLQGALFALSAEGRKGGPEFEEVCRMLATIDGMLLRASMPLPAFTGLPGYTHREIA